MKNIQIAFAFAFESLGITEIIESLWRTANEPIPTLIVTLFVNFLIQKHKNKKDATVSK